MTALAHQVLSALVRESPKWDEPETMKAAMLMQDVRSHHWGDPATRRVAEAVQTHLQAGRAFGFSTLIAQMPDVTKILETLRRTDPIENIRIGLQEVAEQGRRGEVLGALRKAEGELQDLPALTVASNLSEALSAATVSTAGYRHVAQIGSVVEHLDAMRQKPNGVIRLHPSIDQLLRWKGLPVSDSDGETVLIAAPSGHAKTALGIQIALSSAMQGHLTHYNVLADASAFQITERMVHHLAGLNMRESLNLEGVIAPKGIRPRETIRERLMWAEQKLHSLPLELDDSSPDMDQHELRVHLAMKAAKGVRLSVIENLDHMTWDQREERMERRYQLGKLTQIIRQSDRATGHHTVLLAQANRSALEEGDGIARGHHVADSDQPRRHVTVFIGLKNPNVEAGGEATQDILGRVDKNRQGRTGDFTLPVSLVNPAHNIPGEL